MYSFDRKPAATRIMFWAVAILLASWGAAEFSGRALGEDGASPELTAAFCALAVAVLALAAASLALRRAAGNRRQLDALSQALDMALRARSAQAQAQAQEWSLDEINRLVAREVERLAGHDPAAGQAREVSTAGAQTEPIRRQERRARSAGDVETLVNGAIAAGALEVSLRPIVSLSRGAAAAFDAFAHFEADAGNGVDVGRIRDRAGAVDLAAFERMLVMEAAATARRMLGAQEGALVHVPVSEALLSSRKALAAVLEMARAHPAAAGAIVLGLPWRTLATRNAFGKALDRLADAGFAISAEAGDAGSLDPQALGGRARWVRMHTARLLGRRGERGRAMSGHEIADAMRETGLGMIADEVQNDDDAIALADIGIDLMAGPRFSGPRRVRTQAGMPAAAPGATRDAAE